MIVMKFGGTSVNSAQKIQTICQIIKRERHKKPIVVVSALRGVTDILLSLHAFKKSKQEETLLQIYSAHMDIADELWQGNIPQKLISTFSACVSQIRKELGRKIPSKEAQDSIVSNGEILSSHLVSSACALFGIPSKQVSATKLIVTNDTFGEAEFIPEPTTSNAFHVLLPLILKGKIPIVTGFIGATINGKTTTLGRGGSDYSASILGFCLATDEVQFWKDVDGVYTADPRMVKNAQLLENLSYEKASRLVKNGARILHPKTIYPLLERKIPIRVMNSHSPGKRGTFIGNAKGGRI